MEIGEQYHEQGKNHNGKVDIGEGRKRGRGMGREGKVKVGVGSGSGADIVQRRSPCGRDNLSVGGPDPESGRQIQWHRSCGGGVEGGNGDFKLPLHRLHHLLRLPSLFPGGSRYGDRLPRSQTVPSGNGHEGGGPPRNLTGPAQVI